MFRTCLALALVLVAQAAFEPEPVLNPKPTVNKEGKKDLLDDNRLTANSSLKGVATCRDADLARYMNYAMTYYIHDMDALSRSILDQIRSGRKPGQWLVHAQVIARSSQGKDWQTSTNSQVFTGQDAFGCFYHDLQTYILVLRVY